MINALSKRRLLITGGTGSFGETVMQKFLDTDIGEITILSRDEKKQEDMRKEFNNSKLSFFLGDVRRYQSINLAMKNIDFVLKYSLKIKSLDTFISSIILLNKNNLNDGLRYSLY